MNSMIIPTPSLFSAQAKGLWLLCLLIFQTPSHAAQTTATQGANRPVLQYSMHRAELESHRHLPLATRVAPAADILQHAAKTRSLQRVVYGYYPYWVQDLESIRFEDITHLAWFAVELNSIGDVVASHGWPDTVTVEACHAAGVKVHLTFTLFDGDAIKTLVSSNASHAIDNMIDMMEEGNADGISVDFEGLKSGTRDMFSSFICSLRQRLTERGHPNAQISIAAPAVDWNSQFDLDALLDCADWFFIMGYGYFWSGSSVAGPIGILKLSPFWKNFQSWSMLRSLAEYSKLIPASKRRQVIHGVPYYGREWTTDSSDPGSATTGHVGAVTYSACMDDLRDGKLRQYDEGCENPWYTWIQSGAWHQVWYDDEASLAAKYSLALDQDIGGIGMWALNYDVPHQELWNLVEEKFSSPPPTPLGHRLNPIFVDHFPFEDSRDTSIGPGCYFNFYSCSPDLPEYGREWVYEIDVCQPGLVTASVAEYEDRDPDLALLYAPEQDACLARAHTDLETHISPGSYYLVVDTFVDGNLELAGPYDLFVDFTPDQDSDPCPQDMVCADGACQCRDNSLTDCGKCVDTNTDPQNCGQCGVVCKGYQTCEQGNCEGDPDEPDAGLQDGFSEVDNIKFSDTGCGCGNRSSGIFSLLVFFVLILIMKISRSAGLTSSLNKVRMRRHRDIGKREDK